MAGDDGMILTLDCPSTLGIVHSVSGVLLEHGYNIMELAQFNDPREEHFFLRARAERGSEEASTPEQVEQILQGRTGSVINEVLVAAACDADVEVSARFGDWDDSGCGNQLPRIVPPEQPTTTVAVEPEVE